MMISTYNVRHRANRIPSRLLSPPLAYLLTCSLLKQQLCVATRITHTPRAFDKLMPRQVEPVSQVGSLGREGERESTHNGKR